MSRMDLARRAACVAIAGALGIFGASATAVAQRSPPRPAVAADAPAVPSATTPYPGATVIIDPRTTHGRQPIPFRPRHRQPSVPAVIYLPVPSGYPSGGYGGGVYDTNGRPLSSSFDAPAPSPYGFPVGTTPDLSGSPYVVIEGGVMVVDFGYGDQRSVPSCTALAAERTPDGQPRTLFYRPPADGLILRAGQRGQVLGTPPAGARACYTTNSFGRVVLDY